MTRTATLPPPATAAAQGSATRTRRLLHICSIHAATDPACDGKSCIAFCGFRNGHRSTGTTNDPITADDCVVCIELWSRS